MISLGVGELPEKGEKTNFSEAYILWKKSGPSKSVFDNLMAAHMGGDARATFAISSWYATGTYVAKNNKQWIKFLREAVSKGNIDAEYQYAICLEGGDFVRKSESKAFLIYKKCASKGVKDAVKDLERCLFHGIGCKKDVEMSYILRNLSN